MKGKNNKLNNIKYQYMKVSKPAVVAQEPPAKKLVGPQQQQPQSEINPREQPALEKILSPIHAPRTFKYTNTFDRIQASLHELLAQPESVIPIELLHNNPELERIVGTAYVVEERKQTKDKSNISRLQSQQQLVIVEQTNQRSGEHRPIHRQSSRCYENRRFEERLQPEQGYRRQSNGEFSNIRIPEPHERQTFGSQVVQSSGSFQFVSQRNCSKSQFF